MIFEGFFFMLEMPYKLYIYIIIYDRRFNSIGLNK